MKYAWRVVFDCKYIKSTTNPEYDRKSNEQPMSWHQEKIFLTDIKYVFNLRAPVGKYIKEYETSSILGSDRVDLQKIEYIGEVEE